MSTRKIIDAKQNGEKVWLKSHAQATFMSDGSTVEDSINNIESKIDLSDYVTTDELEGYAKIEAIPSLEGYVKESDLPNFDEFAKTEDIPSVTGYATQLWVESQGYAHQEDLLEISFNDIKDSPITENNDGEVNIVDDKGNIALKINDEGLYVKDVIAGNHTLSNKVNASDLSNVATTGDFEQLINKPTIPTQETVEEWGFKTNEYYEKIIKENEDVTAAALTDLDERINNINTQITEIIEDVDGNEFVTASALTDLNDRMMVLENQGPTVTSAKITDAVSTASGITSGANGVVKAKAVYEYAASKQDMIDNEFVVATALTNLDTRVISLERQIATLNEMLSIVTSQLNAINNVAE